MSRWDVVEGGGGGRVPHIQFQFRCGSLQAPIDETTVPLGDADSDSSDSDDAADPDEFAGFIVEGGEPFALAEEGDSPFVRDMHRAVRHFDQHSAAQTSTAGNRMLRKVVCALARNAQGPGPDAACGTGTPDVAGAAGHGRVSAASDEASSAAPHDVRGRDVLGAPSGGALEAAGHRASVLDAKSSCAGVQTPTTSANSSNAPDSSTTTTPSTIPPRTTASSSNRSASATAAIIVTTASTTRTSATTSATHASTSTSTSTPPASASGRTMHEEGAKSHSDNADGGTPAPAEPCSVGGVTCAEGASPRKKRRIACVRPSQ